VHARTTIPGARDSWRAEDLHHWIQEIFRNPYRPGLYRHLDAADVADRLYADASLLETTRTEDLDALPRLHPAGLRTDESVRRALEIIALTVSQRLGLLADQRQKGADHRQKGVELRRLLESSAERSGATWSRTPG